MRAADKGAPRVRDHGSEVTLCDCVKVTDVPNYGVQLSAQLVESK